MIEMTATTEITKGAASMRRIFISDLADTIHVLRGRAQLGATASIDGGADDFIPVPPERHELAALEAAVILVTLLAR